MKKKFIFLLSLAYFILGDLCAQNEQVKSCMSLSGNNSLILDYYDTLTVTYSEISATGQGAFMAELNSYPGGRTVPLPQELKVNDMDFYSENLMFGGSFIKAGQERGALGRLFIPNSFDWGQDVEYAFFDWIPFDNGASVLVTNIKRIEKILDQQSTLSHFRIACVADCIVASGLDTTSSTALCEAVYDNNENYEWTIYVYLNKDTNLVYTDLAVMDNYVVAVAVNQSTNNIHLNLFTTTFPFVNHYAITGIGFDVVDEFFGNQALVESLQDDKFALASHYMSASEAGTSVMLLNCCSVAPALSFASRQVQNTIPVIDKSWDLREMKYEPSARLIYLLHQTKPTVSSNSESVVDEYDFVNFASCNLLSSWLSGNKFFGLGLWAPGGFQTVGSNGAIMTTFKKHGSLNPEMCASYNMKEYYLASPKVVDVEDESSVLDCDIRSVTYTPDPSGVTIDIDCME